MLVVQHVYLVTLMLISNDSENEYVFSGGYLPYQNEPLASESESSSQDDDELDEDGLSVEILRQRYEKEVPVDKS